MNEEFEDRVAKISATIDQLRASLDDGPRTRQLVDQLFRGVHSLKAAAHANNLKDLAARAHQFEDVLHAVRTGKAKLDVDALSAFVSEAPVLSRQSDAVVPDVPIPSELGDPLKDEERHRLAQCVAENANVYVVETTFDLSDFDQRFQQEKEELNRIGEVIATFPKAVGDRINFRILFATKSDLYGMLYRAMRAGQSVAEATGKHVDFSIRVDGSPEKSVCDELADSVMHLVRNAVDHGIEARGRVTLAANETRITVTDDGRGIDPALIDLMFQPGFSTAKEVTTFSGRGVGLDVVKHTVEKLGGSIRVSSEPGTGASFEITLPEKSQTD